MANVVVCSRLIHGLKLKIDGKDVVIKGQNSGNRELIDYRGYDGSCGFTPMDENLWIKIREKYLNSPFIKGGYIFVEKTQASANAHSNEIKNVKIGNEQFDVSTDTPPTAK